MSAAIFAPDYTGMKVSASGILNRIQDNKGVRFMRGEMYKHLETVAKAYYGGKIHVVDEFLQLYCLGEEERKEAKIRQEVAK